MGHRQWQGCPPPPHSLSGRDWLLCHCHSHTQKGTHRCPHRYTEQTQSHTWRHVYAQSPTLLRIQPDTHMCVTLRNAHATHPQAHVITVSTTPRAQTSMGSPRSTAAQTHMWGHQVPSDTVTGGHWQPRSLLPAQPRHPRLTRSLGGWASTAKVDRCWHWQRVWAAWVSRVWQLSVSQSPELASLRWGERWNEPQPSFMAPPPALASAHRGDSRARPHPKGRPLRALHPLGQGWHQGALWPSTQSPCPTHALE